MYNLPLPNTFTEKENLPRTIEYLVTNGWGYKTKTKFSSEKVKNTQDGLDAHLAQLEMHKEIPLLRNFYWMLEEAQSDYEFTTQDGKRQISPFRRKISKFFIRNRALLLKDEVEYRTKIAEIKHGEKKNFCQRLLEFTTPYVEITAQIKTR
jgi:hypothetical protein